jgi:hypothetical protein
MKKLDLKGKGYYFLVKINNSILKIEVEYETQLKENFRKNYKVVRY